MIYLIYQKKGEPKMKIADLRNSLINCYFEITLNVAGTDFVYRQWETNISVNLWNKELLFATARIDYINGETITVINAVAKN